MSTGQHIIELCATKSYPEMTPEEQDAFDDWLMRAKGHDLYLLIRFAIRSRRQSSVQRMAAVRPKSGEIGIDDED